MVIRGTVTDISVGTKQKEQAARFPNGVPAVSDASQSDWMAYVYMQKAKPTNVIGVPVQLTATDPNGNSQSIGTAVSDDKGNYAIAWTPPVPGLYTVTATFAGSESYYTSVAGTAFAVSPAPSPAPTATPTSPPTATLPPVVTPTLSPSPSQLPPTQAPNTTLYVGIAAAVIIAVAAVAAILLRRRK